jgi:hypothetical protein
MNRIRWKTNIALRDLSLVLEAEDTVILPSASKGRVGRDRKGLMPSWWLPTMQAMGTPMDLGEVSKLMDISMTKMAIHQSFHSLLSGARKKRVRYMDGCPVCKENRKKKVKNT